MEPLTNEQLCALAKGGNSEARDALVTNNMGFIRETAYEFYQARAAEYRGLGIELDELVSECCIGLLVSVRRFEPDKGFKFLTYAATAMKHKMRDLVRRCQSGFEARLENPHQMNLTRVHLDDVVFGDEKFIRLEVIADPFTKTPEQICIEKETNREIHAAMESVGPRRAAYLWYRFGFDEEDVERPLAQTAEHFYLSESRAKSIEKSALDDVRHELKW